MRVHDSIYGLVALFAVAGCRSESTIGAPSAAPSASNRPPELRTLAPELVESVLNPEHMKPYSGPIGTVRGVVHVSGDPAPDLKLPASRIRDARCEDARAFYGKLFREGPNRELGDVLVAVTNYPGYLAPPDTAKKVTTRDCAFESRTVALVFGQRIDVKNTGRETVTPELVGAKTSALLVAIPGGDAVPLFPEHVGEYQLVDRSHPFATAAVLVLKFSSFAVTGIDGKFEIPNIPVGDVTVSAYLPTTKGTAQTRVKLVAGETSDVELTIPYSANAPAAVTPNAAQGTTPAASASAR
jgi:hypothetical protein